MTNKQSSLRKGMQQEYINNLAMLNNYSNIVRQQDKVKSFRMQEEYGPKKRIKPWRTSTKSQQQICPKGHKKGFRGKTIAARK